MTRRFLILKPLGVVLFVAMCSSATVNPASAATPALDTAESAGASGPVDPANFTSTVNNPWYPLKPGTTLTYQGTKDEKAAVRIVAVTNKTVVIDGVTCVVVEDQVTLGGILSEKNLAYYAQDRKGNVWTFGEDSHELDAKGQVVNAKSWRAGLDGAFPSFTMEAVPTAGHAFAHAYTKNHFQVVSLSASVKVPYGSFNDALLTKEWSQVEKDVLAHKYYLRGLGEVRYVTVKGPKEEFALVKVAR